MLTLSGAGQPQNGGGVEERFIITVKTDNSGSSADNQFTIPWVGTYDVDWGDGNTETSVVDTQTHTYASAGTYDVKVTAVSGRIRFNNGGDKDKLLDIKNWGTCTWTEMNTAFYGCNSLTVVSASDTPNLSSVSSLYFAFSECSSLTSMDVSNWDVSNVSTMEFAFRNSPITTLDVSNWNTQSLIIASNIFQNAIFSPDVSNWNMSNVTTVREMLRNADLFDRSLANWDISNITNMSGLLVLAPGLSTSNYDATLISWAAQTPQSNININFGGSQYSYEVAAARQTLVNTYNWTITDGGQVAAPEFAIQVKTDNAGSSSDNQFTLSWIGTYDVDWGDGVIETGLANTQTHTYASEGTYNVAVTAASGRIRFRGNNDGTKLIAVKNWGTCVWTSFQEAFFGCYNLTELPSGDAPNLSQVTTFLSTFYNCRSIENWGTISEWDFSNVTQMASMFNEASTIVSEISNFNISNWDVSNVTDLRLMYRFYRNGVQTADIGNPNNWNVSNVATLTPFTGDMNIDTSTWNFSSWDISSATNASVFTNIGLTTDNYDATLISWAAQPVNNNVTANFGSSKYSLGAAAEAARNILINTYNWTISDSGGVYKPVSGLLFDYPNPTSAYSLRALATFQGGISPVVVRVRRSSDNVEQDFTPTEITDGTLISFTGANDGFVVKIYDQSYNLQHIYQNTATRQAKIVNAGSLILEGGLPCIQPAGGYRTAGGENLNYYTNEDSFTYHLQKPDGSVVANNEFFIDSAGAAEYGREGFSFGNNYARINYPYGSVISSISYSRDLTDDIYQPLVWESYPSSLILNDRLKLYNQDGLLADGNTSNTTPTGQGSTRVASFFAAEGGTFRTLEGNWQETILYKEENIPNRDNFLTSISEHYNFPATSGLLFDYPGASAAYSLRNLINTTTNVVRVRRSNDNTEQDFTSTEITDGTLTTFTGANDGFVTTWYDQSGNGVNAVQSTAIEQPKLVSNGVVELDNGKPCIIWDNTNDRMQINTSYSGSNLLSIFSVYNKTTPNPSDDSAYLVWADASLNVPAGVLAWRWGGQLGCYRSGIHSVNGSIPYDTQVNSNFIYTSTQVDFYNNSSLIGSKTSSNAIANFDYTFIQIGRTNGNTSFKNQELIIYQSDQSANRTGIETDINNEYTIY